MKARKARKAAAAFDLASYVRAYRREDRCFPRNRVIRQAAAGDCAREGGNLTKPNQKPDKTGHFRRR